MSDIKSIANLDDSFTQLNKEFDDYFKKSSEEFKKKSERRVEEILKAEAKDSKVSSAYAANAGNDGKGYLYSKYETTTNLQKIDMGYFVSIEMTYNKEENLKKLDKAIIDLQEIVEDAEKDSTLFIGKVKVDDLKKELKKLKLAKYYLSNCK